MTPEQFARAMRAKPAEIERNLMRAMEMTRQDALKAADKQSSGTASQADLNRAGNPFSRARPNSAYDPAVINQGANRRGPARMFRRSWRSSGPTTEGERIVVKIWNVDPNVRFLMNNKKTVDRTVKAAIEKAVNPAFKRRVKIASRK